MKTRFITLAIALVGLFTISSFKTVSAQVGAIPLGGTAGNCTFAGSLNISNLTNDGQGIIAQGTLTGWITDNNGTPLITTDDITTPVTQTINLSVSLLGTTCAALSVTSNTPTTVGTSCGNIDLSFANAMFRYSRVSQGGQYNLITNSLCAISRYYSNGHASVNSLFAHVDNFMRALGR
jgi:hypothetical protein